MRRATAAVTLAAFLSALLSSPAVPAAGPAAADDPPHAHRRLDRISAALAKDPLFVDPDVGHALDASERAGIRRAIAATSRSLGVPVFVVVTPNPSASESQGRDDAFLFALHERSGRDGLYLMANGRGNLESEAFRVPRDYEYSFLEEDEDGPPAPGSWRPADDDRPFDDLAKRIVERMDNFAAAPPASPSMPRLYSTPDPFGEENTFEPAEPEFASPFFTGLLLVGPLTAGVLYGAGVGVGALRNNRARRRAAWTKPSLKLLRQEAAKEVEALRGALAATEAERGHPYAASAYDAAQILYDEAKEDDDRAIDLVGVIVLSRQGQITLDRDVAKPPVFCVVNPLHGESSTRRRLEKASHRSMPKPTPVCADCAALDEQGKLTERNVLMVPRPDGPRPYTAFPGVWRGTSWGAVVKNLPSSVMRSIGVD